MLPTVLFVIDPLVTLEDLHDPIMYVECMRKVNNTAIAFPV